MNKEMVTKLMNIVIELSINGTKEEKNMSNQLLSDPVKFAEFAKLV